MVPHLWGVGKVRGRRQTGDAKLTVWAASCDQGQSLAAGISVSAEWRQVDAPVQVGPS